MMEPTKLTIGELGQLLHDRELSAQELLFLHLERIEDADGEVKAYLRLTEELATRGTDHRPEM